MKSELQQWGVFKKTQSLIQSNTCGELTSLRWTWMTPHGRPELLFTGILAGLLELSEELARGSLERLHIENTSDGSGCFALASFQGEVVAEFEINEKLPSHARAIRFLMADFTGGRITNRPLVGHHHDEGAFIATEESGGNLFFEPLPEVNRELDHPSIQKAIQIAINKGAK